ncbi:MAG: ZIP family metal transporter [Candidatus Woesearchaeota archaeon]
MDAIYWMLLVSVSGPLVGALIGILHHPKPLVLANMLSFAAGVMISISFLNLIPESLALAPFWVFFLGSLFGAFVMFSLDRTLPHIHPQLGRAEQGMKLKRTAIYLIIGMFLHNFPEGIALAIGTLSETKTMFAIAIAIAVHNIPEGICTSAPYFAATKNRAKAFFYAATTVLPIIAGFFAAKLLFVHLTPYLIAAVMAATAAIMIYISADELIPFSCNKDHSHWDHSVIFSLLFGVLFVVMLNSW